MDSSSNGSPCRRPLVKAAFYSCAVALLVVPLLRLGAAEPGQFIRSTGTIKAVRSVMIQVPRLEGVPKDLTLTKIIANGLQVHQGDPLAEFDAADEVKALRDAQAKFDDLRHQVEQKIAEHQNNAEKRVSALKQAQANMDKAALEIRKGPILSEIDAEKNRVELADATEQVASLQRSAKAHDTSEQAEIRVLELQRDRQQIAVDRAKGNAAKLILHSPFDGMVALSNVWRNDSMGHAQEGDQLWPGSPLLRVFDPTSMEVVVAVGEPDGAILAPGVKAVIHLDAFPDLQFTAHFSSASPVATGAMENPVRSFRARFRLDQSDPHLLPDLSAAVDIERRP
jgi:multidrug efflux pump subunit AcrA (membrane-fusion protein)